MRTITAKEAKTRLGQAIDAARCEGVVMITKNGRDSVVMMSAEKYYQMTGVQGFIHDDLAAQKNHRRSEFANRVTQGLAHSTDASMFHGMASQSKVRYLSDEY